jgi:hypothetical protein
MSACSELIPVLEQLSLAYPEKKLDAGTLQLYLDNLDDIPLYLLESAVRAHIQSSSWFPRISDLRTLATRLAGTSLFESLPDHPQDQLLHQAQALEDAFYFDGHFDPAEWRLLAQLFERSGRPYRAEHTLEKLRRLESGRVQN